MLNAQAEKELSLRDQNALKDILAKGKDALTPGEVEHLKARRGYLAKEAIEEFGLAKKETKTKKDEEKKDEAKKETK